MTINRLQPISEIAGAYRVPVQSFADERGQFMESFRIEWFPTVDWSKLQSNRSDSRANVLRGLHYHFHQVDYWYVPKGRIRAGLVDLRPSSTTYMNSLTIEIGEENNFGLFIPIGVAHGFAALTDCTLFYFVNNYYDGGKDEFGVAWDDPDLGLNWGISEPNLSERDQMNPLWRDISNDIRPR